MKISVIIPVFNVPLKDLSECLKSVKAQTLRQHEYDIIVVNDHSSDEEVLEYLQAFEASTDNAVVVHHPENMGLNESRRTGTLKAAGDYVLFVDGDDIISRDAIELLRMECHRKDADVLTGCSVRWNPARGRYARIQASAKPLKADRIDRMRSVLSGNHTFTMCGRLFRRSLLTKDVFDLPPRLYHEDLCSFVRILAKSSTCAHVEHTIYYYTDREASITSKTGVKHVEDMLWSAYDWFQVLKNHGMYRDVAASIPLGVARLMNICAERCIIQSVTSAEREAVMDAIRSGCFNFPLAIDSDGFDALSHVIAGATPDGMTLEIKAQSVFEGRFSAFRANDQFDRGMQPSSLAKRLKGKIVLIGQVDYQLRNCAWIAKKLRERGLECVVLDNSGFASEGRRRLPVEDYCMFEQGELIRIEAPPYEVDSLSTASVVMTFNDFNFDFREALEYRHRLCMPTICAVEGINDFLRQDFRPYRLLPYRRCDFVFLAGEDDKRFFADRRTEVVGIPIIERLARKCPTFPNRPLAALNVNFTYGALEEARSTFISTARAAFDSIGIDWVITQHPADNAELVGYPVTNLTQYELIENCSVFVSRFATGIIEALASGKPAVYFNPHGETADKFHTPLGAFYCARDPFELRRAIERALKDIRAGTDFLVRAMPFLSRHGNFTYSTSERTTLDRFADAVEEIACASTRHDRTMLEIFFANAGMSPSNALVGPLRFEDAAYINELEAVLDQIDSQDQLVLLSPPPELVGFAIRQRANVHIETQVSRGSDAACSDRDRKSTKPMVMGFLSGEQSPDQLPHAANHPDIYFVECVSAPKGAILQGQTELVNRLVTAGYVVYFSEWHSQSGTSDWLGWKQLIRFGGGVTQMSLRGRFIAFRANPNEDSLRLSFARAVRFANPLNMEAMLRASGEPQSAN